MVIPVGNLTSSKPKANREANLPNAILGIGMSDHTAELHIKHRNDKKRKQEKGRETGNVEELAVLIKPGAMMGSTSGRTWEGDYPQSPPSSGRRSNGTPLLAPILTMPLSLILSPVFHYTASGASK